MNTLIPGAPLRSLSPTSNEYQRAQGASRAAKPARAARFTLDAPEHSGTDPWGDRGYPAAGRCVNVQPRFHLHAEPIQCSGTTGCGRRTGYCVAGSPLSDGSDIGLLQDRQARRIPPLDTLSRWRSLPKTANDRRPRLAIALIRVYQSSSVDLQVVFETVPERNAVLFFRGGLIVQTLHNFEISRPWGASSAQEPSLVTTLRTAATIRTRWWYR